MAAPALVSKAQCEALERCIEMMERGVEHKYWDLDPPSPRHLPCAERACRSRSPVPREKSHSYDNGKLQQDKEGTNPPKLTFEDRLSGLERDIQEIKNAILSQKGHALEATEGHEQPQVHSEKEHEKIVPAGAGITKEDSPPKAAFDQGNQAKAAEAIQALRADLRQLDTSSGSRTLQVTFRQQFSPKEVAQRVEMWKGASGPRIPVEPLEIQKNGVWKKPVGPVSFATAGGDARKFVLKLQLATSAKKLLKLSFQVKTSTNELTILGGKSALSEEAASMVMLFGAHNEAKVTAGSAPKFDLAHFFGEPMK